MTAVEMLEQCRTVVAEIGALEHLIDRLADIGAPRGGSAQAYDRVGGATNNAPAARFQALEGCMDTLNARRQQLMTCMDAADKLISLLDDGMARAILRYYYCCGYSDQRIANLTGIARETVTRKRSKAVDYISVKSQKDTRDHNTSQA